MRACVAVGEGRGRFVSDCQLPSPAFGEVLLRVECVSVSELELRTDFSNPTNCYLNTQYNWLSEWPELLKHDQSDVIGMEVVGTIVAFGTVAQQSSSPQITKMEDLSIVSISSEHGELKRGGRVLAWLPTGGACAEFARVRTDFVVPLPDPVGRQLKEVYSITSRKLGSELRDTQLAFNQPELWAGRLRSFLAAYAVLDSATLDVTSPCTILVHATASSVGSALMQMLTYQRKKYNAPWRLIGTVRSAHQAITVKECGADEVIIINPQFGSTTNNPTSRPRTAESQKVLNRLHQSIPTTTDSSKLFYGVTLPEVPNVVIDFLGGELSCNESINVLVPSGRYIVAGTLATPLTQEEQNSSSHYTGLASFFSKLSRKRLSLTTVNLFNIPRQTIVEMISSLQHDFCLFDCASPLTANLIETKRSVAEAAAQHADKVYYPSSHTEMSESIEEHFEEQDRAEEDKINPIEEDNINLVEEEEINPVKDWHWKTFVDRSFNIVDTPRALDYLRRRHSQSMSGGNPHSRFGLVTILVASAVSAVDELRSAISAFSSIIRNDK